LNTLVSFRSASPALAGQFSVGVNTLTFRCVILLGGQRFRQVLRGTWDDYDRQRRVLRLHDAKGRRKAAVSHLLPVSDLVSSMIEALRAFNGLGIFVFSTTAGRSPIHAATLSVAFAEVRGASFPATQKDSIILGRDLRRSVETRLQALGVERDVRAQLLSRGRSSGVQQRHYERHDYLAEKAAALALLERHVFAIVDERLGAKNRRASSAKNSVANSVAKAVKRKTA